MSWAKKVLVVASALVVVALVAAIALYWVFLRSNAPPPAALPVRSTTQAGASVEGAWRVQPGPTVFVGYRMHELFGGDALSRTVVGRTPVVMGTIVISGSQLRDATVTADLRQLSSDEGRRDRYLKLHALESTTFPTAMFQLRSPIDFGKASVGTVVQLSARGDLTMHGVTRSVVVPLQARWNGTTIDVSGQLGIVLADYRIEPPHIGGFVSVDSSGQLELQLTFVKP